MWEARRRDGGTGRRSTGVSIIVGSIPTGEPCGIPSSTGLQPSSDNADASSTGATADEGTEGSNSNDPRPQPECDSEGLGSSGATVGELPSLNKSAGNTWSVRASSQTPPHEKRSHGAMGKGRLERIMGLKQGHLKKIVEEAGPGPNRRVRIEFKGPIHNQLDHKWTASCRIRPIRHDDVCPHRFEKTVVVEDSTAAKLGEAYTAALCNSY